MSHSQTQPLPSFKLVLPSGHHRAILPNLSYPSRSHSHISWSRSLPPLRFAKNLDARSHPTMAFSYASATATSTTTLGALPANDECEDEDETSFCSIPHALRGMQGIIWYNFHIFTGKLKLFIQKHVRIRSAPSSTTSSNA